MGVYGASDSQLIERKNMHVQSTTRWAPAAVGPYSQGNELKKNKFLLLAGLLGFNPGKIELEGSVDFQFDQIIKHANTILTEMVGPANLSED